MPMPETYWDMTVASAAPATHLLNTSTNTKSSTIFITAEIPKKIRGTTELPRALKRDAKKLYKNVAHIPVNIIQR